jgi:hypothetical protein
MLTTSPTHLSSTRRPIRSVSSRKPASSRTSSRPATSGIRASAPAWQRTVVQQGGQLSRAGRHTSMTCWPPRNPSPGSLPSTTCGLTRLDRSTGLDHPQAANSPHGSTVLITNPPATRFPYRR